MDFAHKHKVHSDFVGELSVQPGHNAYTFSPFFVSLPWVSQRAAPTNIARHKIPISDGIVFPSASIRGEVLLCFIGIDMVMLL